MSTGIDLRKDTYCTHLKVKGQKKVLKLILRTKKGAKFQVHELKLTSNISFYKMKISWKYHAPIYL